MALIFDRFATAKAAAGFVAEVKEKYGRDSRLYTNKEEAADADFFPYQLEGAAVVLVDRETYDNEEEIIVLGRAHGGQFAGT